MITLDLFPKHGKFYFKANFYTVSTIIIFFFSFQNNKNSYKFKKITVMDYVNVKYKIYTLYTVYIYIANILN